jgi:hypothetical protein
MRPSDPAVYPHLDIYPAVSCVLKPVDATPVPPMPNTMGPVDFQLASAYPFLVICESPSREYVA